jgi:hypothetical protein
MQDFVDWNGKSTLTLINVIALLFAAVFGTLVYSTFGEEGRLAQADVAAWIEADRAADASM